MAPFRVIIVGGSISGLALANMLEKYDIDFVLLEKHENIAPPLGAGYAMLPYGLRILDQLGCYDVLEKLSTPVDSIAGYDENGKRRVHLATIGNLVNKRSVDASLRNLYIAHYVDAKYRYSLGSVIRCVSWNDSRW